MKEVIYYEIKINNFRVKDIFVDSKTQAYRMSFMNWEQDAR